MLLDVGYVVDNVLSRFQGEKRVVFLARMVIWSTRKKVLYDDAHFSHCDLVLYFRHELRGKIRCDGKLLDRITFDKGGLMQRAWSYGGGNVGVILPSSSCPWRLRYGSFWTPSRVSRQSFPWNLVSSVLWVIILVIELLVSKVFPVFIIFCTSTLTPTRFYWRS